VVWGFFTGSTYKGHIIHKKKGYCINKIPFFEFFEYTPYL